MLFPLSCFFQTMIFRGEQSGHVLGSLGNKMKIAPQSGYTQNHGRMIAERSGEDNREFVGSAIVCGNGVINLRRVNRNVTYYRADTLPGP
jgi:hypothetical protein